MGKKIIVAAACFALGVVAFLLLRGKFSGRVLDLWALINILGLLFLANGVYGLVSGRVFGRSWKKYWGGWLYRQEEPFYFWSYVIGHLLVGIFILLVVHFKAH